MRKLINSKITINILWALLPCVAVLVLTLAGGVKNFPFPDTTEYLELGQNLSNNFTFDSINTSICRRIPGYPLCLMFFSFLGDYAFLAANLLFIFGITWFGMRLTEKCKIKYFYALPILIFLSPGLITLGSVPLSEIAFIFLLTMSIYYFISDKFIISSLALSAATFCRPISILLFLLFAIWMLWKKKKVVLVLFFIVGANLLPIFWTARNYVKYDYPVYTTITGFNLLYYKAGSYLSWKNNIPFNDMRTQLSKQIEGDNIFEQNASAGRLGRKILLDNFWGFCLWAPRDMIQFFMPDITPLFERMHIISGNRGTLDVLRRKGLLAAFNHYFNNNIGAMIATFVYLIFYFVLFSAMVAGIIRLFIEKHYEKLIFGTLLMGYFWILPIGNLDWRFRMPIMPLLFILAVYGVKGLLNWQLTRKLRIE
ncbi:MAG: hypothetical protein KOO69_03745 [Victivallales bacterium]|nr:hypothetical protein [Victivallales bacterium]